MVIVFFYNPFLPKRLIKYYSDDSNFNLYTATIYDLYYAIGYLCIESIFCVDNEEIVISNKRETARLFSEDIEETWKIFNPYVGMEITFVGTFEVFFDGCNPAIISLKVGDKEIVSYAEGKKALLEWAATVR